MGDYTVIADVNHSLLELLREKMVPEPILQPELIGLASPADKGDLNLSLFMYHIMEYGEIRQNQLIARDSKSMSYPPMALDLYFLVTAHSTAELHSRGLDEARILGKVMQVLYDHSVLKGSYLKGTLAENNEEIRIVINNEPIEILTRIWNFPNVPYKLSLSYEVGPVYLDSQRLKSGQRVTRRK